MLKGNFFTGEALPERDVYLNPFLSLSKALINPVPGGTILQLIGASQTGKTTLALQTFAHNQPTLPLIEIGKLRINGVFVDLERSYSPEYARALGVDTSKLLVVKPDYAEQGMADAERLLEAGVKFIIWDSVPAVVTKDELEKTMDDSPQMAGSANKLSRWLIRLLPWVDNGNALFVFVNQYRKNMSTMAKTDRKPYGPEALKYYSKVILELTRIKNERDKGLSDVEILVSKSKIGAEGGKAVMTLRHGAGFDISKDILTYALEQGIVNRSGAWYTFGEMRAQGMESALATFPIDKIRELC